MSKFLSFLRTYLTKHSRIVVPLVVFTGIISARITFPQVMQDFQFKIFDRFQMMKPRPHIASPVLIVDIDDQSLFKMGQWPWPRTYLAELVRRLQAAGAAAVVFDIVFAEADRTSPDNILSLWPKSPQLDAVQATISALPDHDKAFADALKEAPAVMGFPLTAAPNAARPKIKSGFGYAGPIPSGTLTTFWGAVPNLDLFEDAAQGIGTFTILADPDGIIRRVPLILSLADKIYPALPLEALRVAQKASNYIIKSVGGSGEAGSEENSGIVSIKTGNFVIPTDERGQLWLYDTGHVPERFLPVWKIFSQDFDTSVIDGKIIFLGTSAAGLKDIRATPLNPVTAGVEIHAQLAEQILNGQYLLRPDWAAGAEFLYLAVFGLMLIVIMNTAPAVWCAVIGLGAILFSIIFSWYAYESLHWLLDPVFPSISTLVIYLTSSLVHFLHTEFERRQIRNAFSRYMSPALVRKLAENPDQLKLGGEIKEMTVFFSDIRGFTTISEAFKPEELTTFMNEYLTPLTANILQHEGTIDKYIGDAVMAFWNAPLDNPRHGKCACRAALDIQTRLNEWNAKHQGSLLASGAPRPWIKTGIGINTGEACVGNMGSEQRFSYSVLGDSVNLAARFEGLTKIYGVNIIIGEQTQQSISDFASLEIDVIKVKGKNQAVRIFTLLGGPEYAADETFRKLVNLNQEMLLAYRARQWDEASLKAQACISLLQPQDFLNSLYALYLSRMIFFKTNAPPPDWDGITVFTEK
ncbi:MAG: hypothetical protein A2Z83_07475 [Omnitrophica bacterium GWA2_52_8]|nr:MAG: hypothetical protein A2Z83_07475 [Omnitrophica bacterium GWA2_52_8]